MTKLISTFLVTSILFFSVSSLFAKTEKQLRDEQKQKEAKAKSAAKKKK
jgi:hypothetical protein